MMNKLTVHLSYDFGETVYLQTGNPGPRIVTGIKLCPNDTIIYVLSCGEIISEHYDFEITKEKTITM